MVAASRERPTSHRCRSRRHEDRDGIDRRRRHAARAARSATPTESQEALLEAIVEAIEPLADERVAAIGFGIPSVIDRNTGRSVGVGEHPVAERGAGRPDAGAVRPPRGGRERRERRRARRVEAGRGPWGRRPGHAHPWDGRRRRGRHRRCALPRDRRARARGGRCGRPALPGTVRRPRPPRGGRVRQRRGSGGREAAGARARMQSCSSAGPKKAIRPRSRRSPGSVTCSAPRSARS